MHHKYKRYGNDTECKVHKSADVDTHDVFSEKLQLWLLELPRYRKMGESDCKTNKDYWLYTLTHLETMNTAVPFQTQKPIFHKLENMADMAKLTREERDYYHVSLDAFSDFIETFRNKMPQDQSKACF